MRISQRDRAARGAARAMQMPPPWQGSCCCASTRRSCSFNAPQFKRAAEEAAGPGTRWLVLDMLPVTMLDATGLLTAIDLVGALRARGVTLALAGRATQWQNWARSRGFSVGVLTFPSLEEAVSAYHAAEAAAS
jgi:anti-anti-sigma regulatory factor